MTVVHGAIDRFKTAWSAIGEHSAGKRASRDRRIGIADVNDGDRGVLADVKIVAILRERQRARW